MRSKTVVVGIVLGLGLSFIIEGVKMMSTGCIVAAIALIGTILLRTNRVVPALIAVLVFGAACGIWQDPGNLQRQVLFGVFPRSILGVILFFAGAQLVLGATHIGKNNIERLVTLTTAALSVWNVGLAFVLGLMLTGIVKRLPFGRRT